MKLNRTSWLAAGTYLLLALSVQQARAAVQVLYNTADVILAFRASGGQGQNESLLVNVGPSSTFTSAASTAVIPLSLGDLGGALEAQYGSNWFNRTDLSWSVFGSNDPAVTSAILFASRAQTTFGTDAAAWPAFGSGINANPNRITTRNAINSVANAFDGLNAFADPGTPNTPYSAYAALLTNSSDVSSYSRQVTVGSFDFGTVSQWTNVEGNFGAGPEALNLFRLFTSTTNVGKFTISEAGQVTFNGTAVDITAVPEPSKALFGMMGAGALFLRRRRPSAKASA